MLLLRFLKVKAIRDTRALAAHSTQWYHQVVKNYAYVQMSLHLWPPNPALLN